MSNRNETEITLDQLPLGIHAVICRVGGEGALRTRFLDMGLIPGTQILVWKTAPLGDPIEVHLRGYSLTLRKEDASMIYVVRAEEEGELPNGKHEKRVQGKHLFFLGGIHKNKGCAEDDTAHAEKKKAD